MKFMEQDVLALHRHLSGLTMHRPSKLVELARCAHPDFDRVGFEAPVLRLPRA